MNRRRFFEAFAAAVATVAIGLNLQEPMPKPEPQEWTYKDEPIKWQFDYGYVILDPNAIVRANTV